MSILTRRLDKIEVQVNKPEEQISDKLKQLLGVPLDYDLTIKQWNVIARGAMNRGSIKSAIRY